MYAIIQTGGKQFWVIPGETLRVDRLEAKAGDVITLKALWAVGEAAPDIKDAAKATVTAEVVKHLRGPKIIVFKKRVKKAYQKTQGHRQNLTELRIKEISLN